MAKSKARRAVELGPPYELSGFGWWQFRRLQELHLQKVDPICCSICGNPMGINNLPTPEIKWWCITSGCQGEPEPTIRETDIPHLESVGLWSTPAIAEKS